MSSRRIPDPGSLIAGVTFAGIGLIFLVGDVELADRVRWVWPIVLVGLGAGLLAAVLRRAAEPDAAGPAAGSTATHQPPEPSTPVPPPAPEPGAIEEPGLAEGTQVEPGLAGDTTVEPDAARDTEVQPDVAGDTRVERGPAGDAPADQEPGGRTGS